MVALRYQVGVAGEAREVGEQRGVDRAVPGVDRRLRQLVDDDLHDRRRGARRADRRAGGLAGEDELAHRGAEQEEHARRRAARARARSGTTARAPRARTARRRPRRPRAPRRRRRPSRRAPGRAAAARARRRAAPTSAEQRAPGPSAGRSRPSAQTSAAPASGGTKRVAEREQEDVAARCCPRATKNCALRPSRSNSGWAKASAHRPPRCSAARQKPIAAAPAGALTPAGAPRRACASATPPRCARRRSAPRARARRPPPRSRGSRRRACRPAASAPSGRRGRGTRSPTAASSERTQSSSSRTGTLPVMQTWWTTARQRTRSGVPAPLERGPLQPAPAEVGRRVGDGHDERQDVRPPLLAQAPVQRVDRRVVGVERDDERRRASAAMRAYVPSLQPTSQVSAAHAGARPPRARTPPCAAAAAAS